MVDRCSDSSIVVAVARRRFGRKRGGMPRSLARSPRAVVVKGGDAPSSMEHRQCDGPVQITSALGRFGSLFLYVSISLDRLPHPVHPTLPSRQQPPRHRAREDHAAQIRVGLEACRQVLGVVQVRRAKLPCKVRHGRARGPQVVGPGHPRLPPGHGESRDGEAREERKDGLGVVAFCFGRAGKDERMLHTPHTAPRVPPAPRHAPKVSAVERRPRRASSFLSWCAYSVS